MKRWIKRIVIGLVSMAGLLVMVGAAYESVARSRAAKNFPAPGHLVDIGGGRRIQLDCRGTGTPVVVLESGLDGLGSLSWAAVHDAIAETSRTCAYSRAGIMWSDASDGSFSSANVAADLHNALTAAGEKTPYVMVGHSLGGPYILTYHDLYADEVAGVVLVDASHPDQITRIRAAVGNDPAQPTMLVHVAASLAWTGVVRTLLRAEALIPANAPDSIGGPNAAWYPITLRSIERELDGLSETLNIPVEARQLGDLPTVVLTRSEKTSPAALKEMQMTTEQGDRLDAVWGTLQNEEATWSTRSRHEIVPHASHYIQFDQPQVVIEAVRDVIEQVRQSVSDPVPIGRAGS